MGRRKKLTTGRVSAKKKWWEAHKAQPREIHGRQTKEYRRKTGQTKDLNISEDNIKKKPIVDPAWNKSIEGPTVPYVDLPPVEPWYAKIKIEEDGRTKEVKEHKKLLKWAKQLPDIQILRKPVIDNWWSNLPDVMRLDSL